MQATQATQATIVTVSSSEGEVYELLLTQGGHQVKVQIGSLDGAREVVACINNHMVGSLLVSEVTTGDES